uniref:BESS domain-containing protein n=1 Tax=Loa loa TaxID=7209 RepID=A0A1I7W3Y7_LOALO
MKSHSESDDIHKLTQNMEHYNVKKSSSDTTIDIAIHNGKPLDEMSATTISVPVTGKCGTVRQKDEAESVHSIQMIAPILSPNEQNKLRFEQLQQRLTSLSTPLVSMLGTRFETTGESSTDQDLTIDKTDNTKIPIVTLQSASQSIKSKGTHDGL